MDLILSRIWILNVYRSISDHVDRFSYSKQS